MRSGTERQPRRPRSRETLAEAAWRARTARSTEETWLYLEEGVGGEGEGEDHPGSRRKRRLRRWKR